MATEEMVAMLSAEQIVLPAKIGRQVGLKKGARYILFKSGDTIILKKMELPTLSNFEKLTEWGVEFAKKRGIKPKDVLEDD
ncbi:hypothetical protein AUJ66_08580 [Candidatus Desantisbacteria bacterium CG1_02_38_46]|uniref:SpoVT-AbrB domain-containing protein n=3 Tax=unclassified Candidatus Desantisiibacteriota TaxID=3106372 RepID=A0A2H9PCA0_9BACT|nr:MAG: hypothetical protein AUJ66_08580 [Candidatus Desantisbacteria bacterium CG1_02_38_46]PIU51970.1 MAG: hypothetical protein COS91_01725 [Candidatus Desantisbacteria bacterium CG07_land_8_20_14_0_80_39_15]PIZ15850.1 MAG: hypothetical protein COY51_04220 [Candidatus Desantisbacteria bacterium CG_4_10_14_0_8_um_filter_39_17]